MSNPTDRSRLISQANQAYYDQGLEKDYVDGTPHLKHRRLFQFYIEKVNEVFEFAKQQTADPRVLDLGAGEGTATLPFLELGARVTAVDISSSQLGELRKRCAGYSDHLSVLCQDVEGFLSQSRESYDIIVADSFLHHVPDYLGLLQNLIPRLNPRGQFFSFQDPVRYDTAGKFTMAFTHLAYFSWRVFRGDVLGGMQRRLRRHRGVYLDDSPYDNAEYHITRNGVDQEAIGRLFGEHRFDCRIIYYFSTQSSLFQPVGSLLGIKNTFGIISKKSGG